MSKQIELRFNSDATISSNDNGDMVVEGYVNKTNEPSYMLGKKTRFVEKIMPGAWTRAIERAKEIHFYAEHDKEKILASTRNGSLELREDDEGLYMRATISPTSWGKDYYQLIADGILQNMSFGFRNLKDNWKNLGTHYERTVSDLDLFEVSVVRDPAYSASTISARGIDIVEDEVPEDIVGNVVSLDTRASSDEIEILAHKIAEILKLNVTPTQKDETEIEDTEDVTKDTEVQPEGDTTEQVENTKDDEPEVEDTVDPVEDNKDDKQEDTTVDETVTDDEVIEEPTQSNKIRDFINQYKKQEEN